MIQSVGMQVARRALAVLATGCLVAVAGCAGTPATPRTPEQIVAQRAQERWDALVTGDVAKAYGYLSPGTRQVVTLVGYASSIRLGFWKKGRVDKVECPQSDRCEVHVTIEYVRGGTIATPISEAWGLADGNWWYVQR